MRTTTSGEPEEEEGFFLNLTPLTEGSIEDGFRDESTIGVDPSATPAAAEMGGPGGPPPDQD